MWKECNVVLLPTNNKAVIKDLCLNNNKLEIFNSIIGQCNTIKQHIYITSSEVIKENDWCIDIWNNEIIQMNKATKDMLDTGMLHNPHALIIATTDTSLKVYTCHTPTDCGIWSLPQPSQQFIEQYIKQYNLGNIIFKVMVEYKPLIKFTGSHSYESAYEFDLVINSDNTINIKSIKDSWSIEEVRNVCNQMRLDLDKTNSISNESFIDWIENNL